jgi:putative endonuclease
MALFSRVMFTLVRFGARKGIAAGDNGEARSDAKARARRTGIRGETFAYWYLRRHGYIFIARNYTVRGVKGEIDLVGYDGPVLAFVEVKTRIRSAEADDDLGKPEDAVTHEKRRNLSRMARQFLAERRLREAPCRFDVLAIESRPGCAPDVRLLKGAFAADL